MLKNITGKEIESLRQKGAIIIDIREKEEFARKRIKDSINLSINEIDDINYDKEKPIVVCCNCGIRSIAVGERLCELGYKNVYNLDGGIEKY